MFKCLPIIGPCGRQIDHIDRRHSKLEQVPDDVMRNFRTLEECRLDANQIKELPKNFFRLKRIRLLTLSDNELTRLPTGIGSFSSLVELDISRNDISELPASIRFCDSLQSLDVSNNPLQSLPDGFCQLRNLRVLCLNDISISELPEEIGSLQLLEKLELRDNCLKTIPDSFADLIHLEFLDLGANEFQELSPVIGQLSHLSELWIDDNELRSLPEELGNLVNLQQLDLSENLISSLPESISGLVSLSDLNLSQNSITHLPNGLGDLKKLIILKLNQNRLLTLTPTVGNCSGLQELYLTENFLSTLPGSIGDLTAMFHLNVDQNQLTELPTQIGQCISLNILSLRENNLRRLPSEIGNCTRLRVLDVSGNRLDRLPISLSGCSLTALWLSQNQSQPVVTLLKDVDPISHEEYLTCYLLPQEQLDSRIETDPTVSPSELASYSGSVNPDAKTNHDLSDGLSVEVNQAYEPADMHISTSKPTLPSDRTISPLSHESIKPSTILPSPTLSGNSTITNDPSSLKLSSISTAISNKKSPYLATTTTTFTSSVNGNLDPTYTSPNQTNNLSTSSTHSSLSMPTSTSARVHFSGSLKPDESDKSVSKGFPKTRHPRSGKKTTDGYAIDGKSELNHFGNINSPSNTTRDGSGFTSSSESLDENFNDNAVPLSHPETSNQDIKSPIASNHNLDPSAYSNNRNLIKSIDENSVTTINDNAMSTGPTAKPRNKTRNSMEISTANSTSPGYFNHVSTPKSPTSVCRPKLPVDPMIRIASEEDTSENPSHLSSPVKKLPDTLDVQGNLDDDAYSSGGEEIYVISRRVGFTDDVEDNEEKSNQKLIRRDTPHYTKRARIQSKTADGVDSEEAVLRILEKYRASVSPNPDSSLAEPDGTVRRYISPYGGLYAPDIPLQNRELHSPSTLHRQPTATLQEQVEVHIHRQPGAGLGLSVAGGVGSIPFRGSDQGIFVSRLNPTGLAAASGLKLGDKLLEVNGVNLVNVEHHVAVSALRANTNYFRVLVSRDINMSTTIDSHKMNSPTAGLALPTNSPLMGNNIKSVPEHIHCTLIRDSNGLGFSIAGGRGSLPPLLDNEAIYVSKITEGGAAQRQGRIKTGDQIISINGVDIRNARHDEAISLLTSSQSVNLELLRYNVDDSGNFNSPVKTSTNGYITSPAVVVKRSDDFQNATESIDLNTDGCIFGKSDSRVYLYSEKGIPVERITIRTGGGPLGLAICSGSDTTHLPFGSNEPGIFISKISADGAAANTGLRIGDRILRVNGVDLRHATHDEAVQELIKPVKELQLEVRRDPPPPGLRVR
ncbi:unnamed protein product [Heterobilharzia americana]|nr:unnamed protein product [Heterobilharzia americana]